MQTDSEIPYYVVRWYRRLMTSDERRAQRHLMGMMKATHGRSDVEAQRQAHTKRIYSKLLSDEPQVLHLASDGYDSFISRTAARILNEHSAEVTFNRCPKCGELARTPAAKQCRFCRHDWHDLG